MSISFACVAPHPPLLLPTVGGKEEREEIKLTIESLGVLNRKLKEKDPEKIMIFSPHPDWGFNVPLYFLAPEFQEKAEKILTGHESPSAHFKEGKKLYNTKIKKSGAEIALIASGDLSHHLKEEGPYGFCPDGPAFDKALVKNLKEKSIQEILRLGEKYPEAGECGLRSICFLLGILEASELSYSPKILSYEGPFGVGYLVADFEIKKP